MSTDDSPPRTRPGWISALAGLAGGMAGRFVEHPFDTVKVRGHVRAMPDYALLHAHALASALLGTACIRGL